MEESRARDSTPTVRQSPPVRGSLRLTVAASNPQIRAGTDFSVFVTIQNPFDVPITLYQVETHIPIELIDVNRVRLERAKEPEQPQLGSLFQRIYKAILSRFKDRYSQSGIAIAVGTDFSPEEREYVSVRQQVQTAGEHSTIVGVQFAFPQNPSSEELDRIFSRLIDYKRGLVPVQLQPGNSVVKQFVLRTRNWLLFTPLSHTFQIQVKYSVDGADNSDTVPYHLSIASTIAAMTVGASAGAVLGAILKILTSAPQSNLLSAATAIIAAVLASVAVVVAFARKSGAQPMVTVEDFWGGALIGISVGFFGFAGFLDLFARKPA